MADPIRMRATKTLKYDTRHLVAGDDFDVKTERDRRLLKAIKKAEDIRSPADVPAPPKPVAEKIAAAFPASQASVVPPAADAGNGGGNPPPNSEPGANANPPAGDDIKAARAEYVTTFSKQPYNGWSADELRARIAAAKAS